MNLKEAPPSVDAIDLKTEDSENGKEVGEDELTEGELEMTVEDVYYQCQSKLTIESAISKAKNGKKSYTTYALGVLWKDLNIVHHPGKFQLIPTNKELGQLKNLDNKLKKLLLHENIDLGHVMSRVIQYWVEFGKYLKDQGIVQDFPDNPHIGFFLKHGDTAVEFSKKGVSISTQGGLKPYVMD